MLAMIFLVIALLFSPSTSLASTTANEFLKDGIRGTWNSAPPNSATLFFCSDGSKTTLKDLSGLGFSVGIRQPFQWFDSLESVPITAPLGLHTLVVDWQCPMAEQLLRKATELSLIRSPYRWLVLNVTDEEQTQESCQGLAADISSNGSALVDGRASDADVVLLCRGSGSLILVDLWGPAGPTILGKWSSESEKRFESDRNSPAARRLVAGFNGKVFRAGFVITNNDTYKHLTDGVNKHYDFMTKVNYEVCHVVIHMLNGSLEVKFDADWGYNRNGTWNGVIGLQVRGEVEIGGTPTALTYNRLPVQIFLNYQTPVQGVFLFRAPPLSYIYNLFIRPFPPSLWLATLTMVSLGAVMLYTVLRVEEITEVEDHVLKTHLAEGRKRRLDAYWSDVALLTIGAVCQQGSPTEARGYSGRIVTISLFFGILFLYTSYSASIVALLQSTTSNIQHYKDFLNSRIQLGAENKSYVVYYSSTATDTYRRRVYQEKLINHGRRNNFMSLEDGMMKVRSSYFAFFSIRNNLYSIISDTFQEYEKCGLIEIPNFIVVSNPQLTLSKWSTHAEIIRIALRKIQERGIRQRQIQKFMSFKPVCVNQGGSFQSVSLIDCYTAFILLACGIGISACFLLLETLVYPRVKRILERTALKAQGP